MIKIYKILFFNLIIISTLISISAMSWFSAWMGLEMNLLAILPLMKNSNNKNSAEASIKYFIVQAMASSCLLFFLILFSNIYPLNYIFNLNLLPSMVINSTLLLKMGVAPFHFWLPEVVSGLSWKMVFIILTWQKIAPMILLSYYMKSSSFFSVIIILSSLVGGIQGMNQVCLRKIMAYSSINHMGWMICSLLSSLNLWFYYFCIYSLTNFNVLVMFHQFRMYQLNHLSKIFPLNKNLKFMFMLNFLSLGGLPPFIGFFPKWMTIYFLITFNYYTLCFFIVILTLPTLFFYLRISLLSFTISSSESLSIPKIYTQNSFYFYLNICLLSGMPLCFMLSNSI
uniref:NADH-ubiquinone oxidoreductase chain 2 n=1 Tax=Curculionidae sp. 3 AH-2016 TaxID=1903829 RepID=A0A343C2P3_9CUCU|nr:NADH dehydrogenase subunit 2 [Curculionidae sp. 3 AH-2016]